MKLLTSGLLATLLLSMPAFGAGSDALSKAKAQVTYVYKRLAGVPPLPADVDTWAAGLMGAADKKAYLADVVGKAAVENDKFYSVTVLNFAQPETNEDLALGDVPTQMSDFVATIVGLIKDDKDYRQILSGDVLYVPNGVAYTPGANTIYETLMTNVKNGAPLASGLTASTQSGVTGLSLQAGMYTLRGFGSVFYDAGTNRSVTRATTLQYLCSDIEDLSDVSRPDDKVWRDVDRNPGNDPTKYRTECVGCHAGMDALTSAFAYMNFVPAAQANQAAPIVISTTVQPKVLQAPDTFPGGYEVLSDAWELKWNVGKNHEQIKWTPEPGPITGKGPKAFGEMVTNAKAFPTCMAERVYKTVCLKEAKSNADKLVVDELGKDFAAGGFNMKELFKATAAQCSDIVNL